MRDLIDERNFREKSRNSIIKGYNVHFMTKEELDAQKAKEAEAQRVDTTDVTEGAAGNTQTRPEETELSAREREHVTEEQIRKILGEREERIAKAFEEHSPQKNMAAQETTDAEGTQDELPANDASAEEVEAASGGDTVEEVVSASDGTTAEEVETVSAG